MTDQEFEALISRLETEARRNPAGYKTRVLLTALLGNAYLGAVLLVITALLAAAIGSIAFLKAAGAKIAFVIGVFLWVVLKALWVRIDPPEGMEVTAKEAPELFAMIESLRKRLGSPRFHHVLVTGDFNAGVVQAPRLGAFGWYRNYLLIGLPLAKALTVDQFKAVLAHELGHLAAGHGRVSSWIYRQRLRWSRLMDALESVESRGLFLFRPFLRWYAPYFNALSFPLARANEYEADATSARLASPRAAAEALTGVNVVGSYLRERYWPEIHGKADDLPQPSFAPYSGMGRHVSTAIDDASIHAWLKRALARKTTVDDTHPSLTDRLGALDESPRLALPGANEAADRLLGEALQRITQAFDRRWQDDVWPSWEERHREVQEGKRRLAELDARYAAGSELSLQEAYDRACLTESFGAGDDAALEQLRALHRRAPDDPVVLFSLGSRLLARDDPSGCPLLERAMERDESEIVRCCEVLRDYFWRNRFEDEARAWHRRMTERVELEHAAARERDEVRLDDKLERHGLPDETVERMRAALKSIAGLRKAYFVRKRVKHMTERPCYLLGFTIGGWLKRKRRAADVQKRILDAVPFPGEALVINVQGENYRFGWKLAWMRGSRIR